MNEGDFPPHAWWSGELEDDEYLRVKWGKNFVGKLRNYSRSTLPLDNTRVCGIRSGEFDQLWIQNELSSTYDKEAYRVIQPTTPSVTRAISKWAVEDQVCLTPEMVEFVYKYLPELRKYPIFCRVSETSTLDFETFCAAFLLWLDCMEQYKAPQRRLDDPEVKFNKSTVAGPVYSSAKIPDKEDGLKIYPVYSLSWAERCHYIPTLYGHSGKEELIKKSKYETGNIRGFAPMPLDGHVECMYLFSGIHIRMADLAHDKMSPIGVGWRNQHGGFMNEMKYRATARLNVDSDVEKWDAKFSRVLHWMECGWHLEVAKEYSYRSLSPDVTACDAIYSTFRDMACTYVYNSLDGSVLYFDVGQPSGTTKTSYSNSTGHVFISCYHYVSAKEKISGEKMVRYNWPAMCKDVTFKVYGDDNGTCVFADNLVKYYSFEELDKTYKCFNLSLDRSKTIITDNPRRCDQHPGVQWLGFRCGANFEPMFDTNKALCSMLNPSKRMPPDQRLLKAVSLMINITFSDRIAFETIRQYALNLVKSGVVPPNYGFSKYSSVPTHSDCVSFWSGEESSSSPEIVSLLNESFLFEEKQSGGERSALSVDALLQTH